MEDDRKFQNVQGSFLSASIETKTSARSGSYRFNLQGFLPNFRLLMKLISHSNLNLAKALKQT